MSKEKKSTRKKHILNILIVLSFFAALTFMYLTIMSYLDKEEAKKESEDLQSLYYGQVVISEVPSNSETLPVASQVATSQTPLVSNQPIETEPPSLPTARISPSPIASEEPTPSKTPEPTPRASFEQLLAINEDVVGWLKVDGTTIDYPVLQGVDNDYYIEHNIYGNKTLSASIFMDYRSNVERVSKNIIIYGHNMGNGYMFSNLEFYVDHKVRDEFVKENPYIVFDSIYQNMTFEIFAAYVEEVEGFQYLKTDFNTDAEFMSYINSVNKLSLISTDVTIGPDDKIITLSTCNHWFLDSRTVVQAKLISK